ncbi:MULTISPECIES: N-acetylmuramoyl-L-alanine amidase family protein [Paenibacillus]|jgi:N-acetylmuramoyl-L-alanine amidase|uniref:N-acetylmuramoyl-L-alanine amidase family protein n=1 Tax=Paenibacillus TaxID=44249 RepID=UPI00073F1507|nr:MULTISPECIES: N-acetylmuramoyl-L-alanine amidase [Paenibacillus]MDU4694645.1 N-acetylmuramoyl-L-alanine amidase [Paenibacillus sp.]
MGKMIRSLLALMMTVSTVLGLGIPPAAADEGKDLRHAFPEPVILIDAGHGGIDGGTSYEQILEKDINLEIGRRLYVVLRSHGYRTILNRTGDYALSDDNRWLRSRSRHLRDLAQRKELSEQLPASIVVSLHVNWGRNASKRGPLVLHQNEGRSALLAASIQRSLERFYRLDAPRTPELGKPFYLLNHIDCPAVIVETGFLSNAEDRAILTNRRGQQRIAEALYHGITEYFTVM